MKKVLLISAFLSSVCFANDYGDQGCQIVLTSAANVITGCCGNYFAASVSVSKALIARDFKSGAVKLSYNTGDKWLVLEPQSPGQDAGKNIIFNFKFPFGAVVHSQSLSLVPVVTNGVDQLFDNNFGSGSRAALLNSANNWSYKNQICGPN